MRGSRPAQAVLLPARPAPIRSLPVTTGIDAGVRQASVRYHSVTVGHHPSPIIHQEDLSAGGQEGVDPHSVGVSLAVDTEPALEPALAGAPRWTIPRGGMAQNFPSR